MEDPIFHLSGVVKSKGEMQDFTGPLALILQLLSKNKVEIKDIPIALILEQYLEYLDTLSDMDLEVASEFVAMASHLVLIKTKMLLAGGEDVTELTELISSLDELRRRDSYAQIKTVTGTFADMVLKAGVLMVKPPEYLEPDKSYKYQHELSDLTAAFRRLTAGEEAIAANPGRPFVYPKRITYSVQEKVSEILQRLRSEGAARMSELIAEAESRSEVVAVFIAVLELCRSGVIELLGAEDDYTCCFIAGEASDDDEAEQKDDVTQTDTGEDGTYGNS
jgi:segregation and condensation protein A